MVMSRIWCVMVFLSVISAFVRGRGAALAAAVLEGSQAGVTLALSMAGALCLWSGVGALMDKIGFTQGLASLLRPLLRRVFPGTEKDPVLARELSANISANFLGLGNAATPMGIRAVQRMRSAVPGLASDEMCRLIVLNTASIQLIPAGVAAVRSSLGCATPFDILPAVWLTSITSAGLGLAMAWGLGKVWHHD